jgi:hypothetical protein
LGGAIFNDGGSVTIVNATLSGNLVDDGLGVANGYRFGAGVYSRNGLLSIANSTITQSTAGAGRGVYVLADGATATVQIDSTIIGQADFGHTITELALVEDNGGAIVSSGEGNLIRRALSFNGTVVSTDDPLLGPLADYGGRTHTHSLPADSPAINQGTNPLNLSVDQRGQSFARVSDSLPDIGAFELQTPGTPELAGDYNDDLAVSAADYVLWRNALDTDVAPYSGADGTGDGRVDGDDYVVWRANFGSTSTTTSSVARSLRVVRSGEPPRLARCSSRMRCRRTIHWNWG